MSARKVISIWIKLYVWSLTAEYFQSKKKLLKCGLTDLSQGWIFHNFWSSHIFKSRQAETLQKVRLNFSLDVPI